MGLDIDYIYASNAITKIEEALSATPQGERKDIADKIIAFANTLEKKG